MPEDSNTHKKSHPWLTRFGHERPAQAGPGRKPIPSEQKKALAEITKLKDKADLAWHLAFEKYRNHTYEDLDRLRFATHLPNIEFMVIQVKLRVAKAGSPDMVSKLKAIECGPDRERIELSGPDGESLRPYQNISTEELIEAFRTLQTLKGEEECLKDCTPPSLEAPALSSGQSSPSLSPQEL